MLLVNSVHEAEQPLHSASPEMAGDTVDSMMGTQSLMNNTGGCAGFSLHLTRLLIKVRASIGKLPNFSFNLLHNFLLRNLGFGPSQCHNISSPFFKSFFYSSFNYSYTTSDLYYVVQCNTICKCLMLLSRRMQVRIYKKKTQARNPKRQVMRSRNKSLHICLDVFLGKSEYFYIWLCLVINFIAK